MANNTLIGAIRAEATLESGKFVDGAKKIRQEAVKTEATVKRSFSAAGAAIKGFGGALAAGLSIGALTAFAKKAIDFAREIGTTAKQLGVTTEELQKFRYAAGQVGIKTAEADQGLKFFQTSLSKAASGSKPMIKAFEAVGISLEDIKTKSRTEIFGKIGDQMIKQGGAARNAAAGQAIFGEGVSKLTPLLDKGSRGMSELSAAAERLGIVLSDERIQSADETARKLEDVKNVLAAQIAGVVADNASSIVSLANALASLTSSIINFLGSNPQAALGILGALAGARFGLPGAAAGGLAGMVAGSKIARGAADANMDPRFRAAQIRAAQSALAKARSGAGDPTGKLGANPAAVKAAEQELARQTALGRAALARKSKAGAGGGGELPQFLAPAAGGGRKARVRKGPRDRSEQNLQDFERDERRAQIDILRAKQSLATDYSERATLAVQILDLERVGYKDELEYEVAQGRKTQAQADQLLLLYDQEDSLKRQAIIAEEQERVAADANAFQALILDLDMDLLQSRERIAETADEQRQIQLDILDLAYRQKRAALEAAIATEKEVGARQRLELELDRLNETYANNRKSVIQGTRGPIENFAASLPTTAGKMNEALQDVAVNGLQSLEDGLISVMDGTKSLADAFSDMAKSIIADLVRIAIQKYIVATIGRALFPSAGFSDGGYTGGYATGGYTGAGNIRKIAGLVHKREFVLNAMATKRLGVPTLNALNRGAPLSAVSNDNSVTGVRGDVHIHMDGPMSDREARRTGMQAAAGYKSEMARVSRKGIA